MAVETVRPPGGAAAGPGRMTQVVDWLKGVRAELNKVTWPDRAQVRQATIAIIIFVLVIGLVITLLDLVLRGVLVQLIPSLFAGS